MSLLEFYKEVVENLGLTTSEDGYIYAGSGNDKVMMTVDGKPLVLPTKEHLNTLLDKNEDGEIVVTKIPYNPLNENIVKGDTLSLKKTKLLVERRLGHAIAVAGELLLTLASNKELQKKTSMEINKFLSTISQAQNPGIKQLVDDKSIDNWINIYKKCLKSDKGMISIFLKKAGSYKGNKYNRLATLTSPVYDALLEADKDTPIFDVRLRNKDIVIFKLIFQYLLEDLDDNNTISIGSNDNESPAFVALFKLYITTAVKIDKVIKALSTINEETADSGKLHLTIPLSTLDNLGIYKGELLLLPNENDLNRSKVEKQREHHIPALSPNDYNKNVGHLPQVKQQVSLDQPLPYQPQEEMDPIKKILYGNNVPVIPTMQRGQVTQQQPMYGQQQYGMQQQLPMGINSGMVYQQLQPMMQYQQPMYGQQQYGMQQQLPMGINSMNQGFRF